MRDRVCAGDVLCTQARMGNAFYPGAGGRAALPPPLDLHVVYEDDHFAIVNKPAGINVNRPKGGGGGGGSGSGSRLSVRSAAPYVLRPPRFGTLAIIRRPCPVHRLDKPTSGLLLIAKTKPAMVDLSRQFRDRTVKKTYTAIINGWPRESSDPLSSREAHQLGVDVGYHDQGGEGSGDDDGPSWHLIDCDLRGKSAVTVWRTLRRVRSERAQDRTLTLVELKPKSGRYHQLRRHMALVCGRPIVGDRAYSGESGASIPLRHQFLDQGLFLCSNKVVLEHPYFNTREGRREWNAMEDGERYQGGMVELSQDGEKVMVQAEIDLPQAFCSLLDSDS